MWGESETSYVRKNKDTNRIGEGNERSGEKVES